MIDHCLYHCSDLDGHCSGAIVKRLNPGCVLHPINYGYKTPEGLSGTVAVVDFCLQPFEKMKALIAQKDTKVILLDHHKTAIQDYNAFDADAPAGPSGHPRAEGILRDGIGACALVWEHLVGTPIPIAVQLLAEYDVWKHDHPWTLPFQYGIKSFETDPNRSMVIWQELLGPNGEARVREIVEHGQYVKRYQEKQDVISAHSSVYQVREPSTGQLFMATNGLASSRYFEPVFDKFPEALGMVLFKWKRDQWKITLYSRDDVKLDVSVIAKANGGGGHAGAAGFECSELPSWVLQEVKDVCSEAEEGNGKS